MGQFVKKFYLDELPQFYFPSVRQPAGRGPHQQRHARDGHKRSSFGLLMLDLWIVWRGFLVIVKGGGIREYLRRRGGILGFPG